MHLPERVNIMEVGPRDGLQNEPVMAPTEQKLALIRRLIAAGLRDIEATSFVHPRWIPALADADDLFAALPRDAGVRYSVLIPNMRGYERAAPLRPDEIVLFCSASESHNRANLNRSVAESLAGLAAVAARARADGIRIRGAISTSFWCPFEGRVPEASVVRIAEAYQEMGAGEIGISDTLGAADPLHIQAVVAAVRQSVSVHLGLHLHDTYGMSLACVVAGLDAGITHFDSSIGGLGGCPYAPGAAGNIATEDLVFMLHRMGVQTGIDEEALMDAARYAQELVGHPLTSRRMSLARAVEPAAT